MRKETCKCLAYSDGSLRLCPVHAAIHKEAVGKLLQAQDLVTEQAENEGLWFVIATAPEAYLQQELRRLHEVISPSSMKQPRK